MEDIFKDFAYEELDFISKATKPAVSTRIEQRSKLTSEEIVLSYEQSVLFHKLGNQSTEMIANVYGLEEQDVNRLSRSDIGTVVPVGFELNLTKQTVINPITMTKFDVSDETILNSELRRVYQLRSIMYEAKTPGMVKRIKEVIILLGGEKNKSRSVSKLIQQSLKPALTKTLFSPTTNIRNYDLFEKIIKWIHYYIVDGTQSCYVNLSRIKTMTTISDNPIYSVQEV